MTQPDRLLDEEYEKLRYKLIRYGDFPPDTKATCDTLFHRNKHAPQIAFKIAGEALTLLEKYREHTNKESEPGINELLQLAVDTGLEPGKVYTTQNTGERKCPNCGSINHPLCATYD